MGKVYKVAKLGISEIRKHMLGHNQDVKNGAESMCVTDADKGVNT